jgi:hypothetical protein
VSTLPLTAQGLISSLCVQVSGGAPPSHPSVDVTATVASRARARHHACPRSSSRYLSQSNLDRHLSSGRSVRHACVPVDTLWQVSPGVGLYNYRSTVDAPPLLSSTEAVTKEEAPRLGLTQHSTEAANPVKPRNLEISERGAPDGAAIGSCKRADGAEVKQERFSRGEQGLHVNLDALAPVPEPAACHHLVHPAADAIAPETLQHDTHASSPAPLKPGLPADSSICAQHEGDEGSLVQPLVPRELHDEIVDKQWEVARAHLADAATSESVVCCPAAPHLHSRVACGRSSSPRPPAASWSRGWAQASQASGRVAADREWQAQQIQQLGYADRCVNARHQA